MNNTIIWSIIGVVVIGGVFLFAFGGKDISPGGGDVEQMSSSALVADSMAYDFGEIGIFDGKVKKEFTLTNSGADELVILAGTTSCGCTDGEIDGVIFGMHEGMARTVSIGPGESKILTATYDPLAHGPDAVGKVIRQLFLKTNSTETPELEIRVSANVVKESN